MERARLRRVELVKTGIGRVVALVGERKMNELVKRGCNMRVLVLSLAALLVVGCGKASPPPAPPPAPAVQAPPPDADHDGVPDSSDKCPNTPAGVAVDQNGCPLDADNDGVPDSLDKCPNTPAGVKVDETGCAVRLAAEKDFTLKVDFASGSATINGDITGGVLADVAALLKQYPESTVRIEGYTDDRGSAASNKSLSQKRAEAVAKVLVDKLSIDTARVSAKGFGEANPVASNKTAEGREQNRRVVAVVLPAPPPAATPQS